jgi:6-phosphogluconolactonase (cycloisomerase 2 family)
VSSGTGNVPAANVTNISINCVTGYTIGGTVSNLVGSVVLQNNGGNNLSVSANGPFAFSTPLVNGAPYAVTVLTQPSEQICTVGSGTGNVPGANVTSVSVNCVTKTYTIGGTVSNLVGSVVLRNNGGNNLTVTASGPSTPFTFSTPLINGAAYAVTVLTQPTEQICTVGSGTGNVPGANVTNIIVNCVTKTYTIGGTVSNLVGSVVLQNNGGNNLTVPASGSSTPFTFSTPLVSGAPYAVSVLTHPADQFCKVTNGVGAVAGMNVTTVAVNCVLKPIARFAYLANSGDKTVSIYTVNKTTGQLRHNGYVLVGTNPTSVTVDPAGQFAFVANQGSANVSAFTINASTGALTPVAGSPFTAGTNPTSVTVDPLGQFAFVANQGSANVSAFTITGTGALTPVAGSPFTAGTNPSSVIVDPSGEFAYVANQTSNTVSTFAIATGVLTPQSLVTGRIGSVAMALANGTAAVTYTPKFAYVANEDAGNVSGYTIKSTGVLNSIFSSPYSAGSNPVSVTVEPTGRFAYVTNFVSNDISAYTVNASTGKLTPMSGSPFAAGINPNSVSVDPSGRFAYVANYNLADPINSNFSAYTIDATSGALTSNGTVASGIGPYSVAIDPSGKFFYVANFDTANVSAYTINATSGALNFVGLVGAGSNPISVSVDPTGRFVHVANFTTNDVSAYSINATTGALSSLGLAVAAGTGPTAITADPSGKFAYVANQTSDDVSAFSIDATTGVLTPIDADAVTGGVQTIIAAGDAPASISIDPSGKFAYVANNVSDNVTTYSIDATGALTRIGTANAKAGAISVTTSGKIQ